MKWLWRGCGLQRMWLLDNQRKGTVDRAWSGPTATVKWESWETSIQEMWIRCQEGDTVCSTHAHSHTCTCVCTHHTHTLHRAIIYIHTHTHTRHCVCIIDHYMRVCTYVHLHRKPLHPHSFSWSDYGSVWSVPCSRHYMDLSSSPPVKT